MKTTELFVEQTLTGFLVLTAAAAPFLSWESLQTLPARCRSLSGRDGSGARDRRGAHRHLRLGLVEDHGDIHAVSPRLPEMGPGKEMTA
jgi:hypothetical protein